MEETKWLTKTKIIIMSSIILVIGLIVIFIVVHRHNLINEYKKYESQLEYAAPNYLLKERISLKENEWREIKVKDILKQKLITNKRSSDCDGYVIAQGLEDPNKDEKTKETSNITYKAYIKCKNIYTTQDYGNKKAIGKQNNEKTQTQKDTQEPEITLFGDKNITIYVGEKYEELGAMAIDNVDKDVTKNIKISGKVDTTTVGTYKIKYTVTDSSNNKATITRTVIVKEKEEEQQPQTTTPTTQEPTNNNTNTNTSNNNNQKPYVDTTAPIITFNISDAYQRIPVGRSADISVNGIYGYVARDNVDGNITSRVKITGNTGVINTPGTYNLYYEVSDSSGNRATATRQFTVYNPNTIPDTTTVIPVTSVNITPNSIRMGVGSSYNLSVSIYPSNATNKTLTYTSSNTSVATVDSNGTVKAISKGTTTIKATSYNSKIGACTVTVQ